MSNKLEFIFDNKVIEFDMSGEDVMINATEMGKIYGKEPYDFLKQSSTKRYIEELKSAIPAFRTDAGSELNAANEVLPDEYMVRTDRGKAADGGVTWMHRQLAIKFAAWLDPKIEVWIYQTIDTLIFDHVRRTADELKEKAKLADRRDALIAKLQANPDFQEYILVETKIRQSSNKIARFNSNQLSIFRGL